MADPEPAPGGGAPRAGLGELELGVWAAGLIAAALVACSLWQDLTARAYGYTKLLDVDVEASAYTWLSSSLLLVTALAILHTAFERHARRAGDWRGWGVLGLVFLGLSAEEVLAIHERIGHRIVGATPGWGVDVRLAWAAPALALCVPGLMIALPFLRSLPSATQRRMLAAGLAYVGGGAGVEAVQGGLAGRWPVTSLPMILLEHAEEGLEVAGTLLMLRAVGLHHRGPAAGPATPAAQAWPSTPGPAPPRGAVRPESP